MTKFSVKIAFSNAPSLGLFTSLGFQRVSESQAFQEATLELAADAVDLTDLAPETGQYTRDQIEDGSN